MSWPAAVSIAGALLGVTALGWSGTTLITEVQKGFLQNQMDKRFNDVEHKLGDVKSELGDVKGKLRDVKGELGGVKGSLGELKG